MTSARRESAQLGSSLRNRVDRLLEVVAARTSVSTDTPDDRRRKASLVVTTLAIVTVSTFWVVLYGVLGLWASAAIPFAYQVVSLVCVVLCFRTRNSRVLLFQQL